MSRLRQLARLNSPDSSFASAIITAEYGTAYFPGFAAAETWNQPVATSGLTGPQLVTPAQYAELLSLNAAVAGTQHGHVTPTQLVQHPAFVQSQHLQVTIASHTVTTISIFIFKVTLAT